MQCCLILSTVLLFAFIFSILTNSYLMIFSLVHVFPMTTSSAIGTIIPLLTIEHMFLVFLWLRLTGRSRFFLVLSLFHSQSIELCRWHLYSASANNLRMDIFAPSELLVHQPSYSHIIVSLNSSSSDSS